MNKLTRLTALLLALLMIFSTIATAESYPVGSMTQEQWAELVKQAEDELFTIPEDVGQVIPLPTPTPVESKPYVTTHAIALSESEEFAMSSADNALLTSEFAAQWQIMLPGGVWADLAGQTGNVLEVNYAMLKNVLTDNAAELRQVEYDADHKATVLDAVKIKIEEPAVVASLEAVSREGEAEDTAASTDANGAYLLQTANEEGDTIALVTVEYLYKATNETVRDAYQANASKQEGGIFTHTIDKLPVQPGYIVDSVSITPAAHQDQYTLTKQTQNDDGSIATEGSLTLNLTGIVDDQVTVTVYYVPAYVQYKVAHYQQKLGADSSAPVEEQYELVVTDTYNIKDEKHRKTGEAVGSGFEKEYEGFTALWYDPELPVAANGSTTLSIYYVRNYYLMSFVLGEDAYGVNPIYAQYGAPISNVGTPKRPGYTFVGWTTDANNTLVDAEGYVASLTELPTTMPAENTTYYAVWDMADTAKVTVVFWGQNANNDEYSYLKTGSLELASGSAFEFTSDYMDDLVCATESHTHTTECGPNCEKEEHTVHTDSCYTCGHTHTIATCYSLNTTGNTSYELRTCDAPEGYLRTPVNGEIVTVYPYADYGIEDYVEYYLYINGNWYCAYYQNRSGDWSESKTTEIEFSCSHTHTSACLACEYHEHNASCYSCGKVEHAHTTNCSITMDTTLWELVKSDKVTVTPDGSKIVNVYYDRKSFTLTFKFGNNFNTTRTITAKWGKAILTEYNAITDEAGGFMWSESTSGGPYTNYFGVMPAKNATYYLHTDSGSLENSMIYYLQDLQAADATKTYTEKFRTTWYSSSGFGGGYYSVTEEDFFQFEGFSVNEDLSVDVGADTNAAKFYYDRHHYAIEYYSPLTQIKKVTGVAFEETLGKYAYTPTEDEIPDIYEDGSVVFGGWYLNPECTGEEFVFSDEHKMSACPNDGDTGLVVYAKWVPKEYEVKFYLDSDTSETGTLLSTQTVQHGSNATAPENVTNGALDFVVWVYLDENGNEVAVQPETFRITGDTVFYAKWEYKDPIPVTIYYKLDSATGADVAEPYEYQMMYIESKTFEAKTGDDLYEAYRSGYYPTTTSHTIVGSEDEIIIEDGVVKGFEYTFIYEKVDQMSYTVNYLEEGTNVVLHDPKVVTNTTLHIVIENYEPIAGYMPKEYTKRLVLVADTEQNVINFYYVRDTENALYTVTHYVQNQACTAYEAYGDTASYPGRIGTKYGTPAAQEVDSTVITTGISIYNLADYVFSHAVIVTRVYDETNNTTTSDPTGVEEADVLNGFSDTAFETYIITDPAEVVKALTTGGMDIHLYYNRKVTTLTIKKVGLVSGEHAIANVMLNDDLIQVVLDSSNATTGVTIENVPIGTTFSISEPDWAWRYDTVTIDIPSGTISGPTTVTITNSDKEDKWLDSECYAENVFGEAN